VKTRRAQSPLANPVLIGAVTVLIAIVAVFLAYNANKGLPFVPYRILRADFASGAAVSDGDEVVNGGSRIGFVSSMKPVRIHGRVIAQLTLKLNSNERIPVDSTATIASRNLLGLKYISINLGRSRRVIPNGGVLPLSQTSVPVQLDQIFNMFTPPVRRAIQQAELGVGDTLASRGPDLNQTIVELPPLFGYLTPVAGYLSAPQTQLIRFIDELNGFTGTVAPVSQTAARLFGDAGTTFAAISQSPPDLEATIRDTPPTLAVGTRSLAVQQPFLSDFTALNHDLTPATGELRAALPGINPALEQGARVLARTPPLDGRLERVLIALKRLAQAPSTDLALVGLTSTVDTLNPMIRYLGPFVTVCNDWNYWWTYLAGDLDAQTNYGYAQRALLNQTQSSQPDNVGSQGATTFANGGGVTYSPTGGGNEYLHAQTYGAAVTNNGYADCETGQRGYVLRLNYYDPQHRNLATDAHTPGAQGTTFTGRARVPAGETYSRAPQTGPQLPPVPGNN
jgi:virulence factor Mce-like protein